MEKAKATTEEDVKTSVSSIYAALLSKRQAKKAMEDDQKRMEKELKEQEKLDEELEENKLTKKEKRQKELDSWKEIVIGLTGDDLEYTAKKKSKKKYRKWVDDDDMNAIITQKPKKAKKRNYNKEFEPELNMLRTIVAEQNRFTADLQKRFQNAAGPATKDAQFPNKTLVELAAAITSGRSNSLGMLREIGNLKKTIAELYMKQAKLDSDMGKGGSFESNDVGLMGSNIASSMFSNDFGSMVNEVAAPVNLGGPMATAEYQPSAPQFNGPTTVTPINPNQPPSFQAEAFDPANWDGPDTSNSYSIYESTPHSIVVEKNQETGAMRFKAVKDSDGSEFVGCPVPTSDVTKLRINETDGTVKGEFDEVYKLVYA